MITIYNTCWGDYSLNNYSQILKDKFEKLGIPCRLLTDDFKVFKQRYINNLNGDGIIIENQDKNFIVLYYGDQDTQELKLLEEDITCIGVISVNRKKQRNLYELELPYFEKHYLQSNHYFNNHYPDNLTQLKNESFFIGALFDNRKAYIETVKNQIPVNLVFERYPPELYFKTLKQYKAVVSPPGGCDINTRDVECFGLGIPIIRDTYLNYEELKPDEHYIPTETVLTVGAELFKNSEYLLSISKNAREYYRNYFIEHKHFDKLILNFLNT